MAAGNSRTALSFPRMRVCGCADSASVHPRGYPQYATWALRRHSCRRRRDYVGHAWHVLGRIECPSCDGVNNGPTRIGDLPGGVPDAVRTAYDG